MELKILYLDKIHGNTYYYLYLHLWKFEIWFYKYPYSVGIRYPYSIGVRFGNKEYSKTWGKERLNATNNYCSKCGAQINHKLCGVEEYEFICEGCGRIYKVSKHGLVLVEEIKYEYI